MLRWTKRFPVYVNRGLSDYFFVQHAPSPTRESRGGGKAALIRSYRLTNLCYLARKMNKNFYITDKIMLTTRFLLEQTEEAIERLSNIDIREVIEKIRTKDEGRRKAQSEFGRYQASKTAYRRKSVRSCEGKRDEVANMKERVSQLKSRRGG